MPTKPADRLSDLRDRVRAHPQRQLELLREYQNRCWQDGARVPVEELIALLSPTVVEDALVLIWGEVQLRTSEHEVVDACEYRDRFPHLADAINRQFELEQLLDGWTTAGAGPPAVSVPPSASAGRYVLGAEIGRGGMGVVFRATDTTFDREVAVKVLLEQYDPASGAARRFADEARITAQLQHPGIPSVHDLGTLPDGRPFLTMKLIQGQTLAHILAEDDESRSSLLATFEQVCQAVAYAHDHGVIHRDLKPANVMVGSFGEVQVMDWGLAKFRAGTRANSAETSLTNTLHDSGTEADENLQTRVGALLGTPAYMSPEQALGAVDLIDERSDVFGLGAVLCAILTGKPPFVAQTPESTQQLAAEKTIAPAFARLNACGAEPALVALCKRCVAGEREERLRNAGEVAAAVRAIRVDLEGRARQVERDRAVRAAEAREQRKRRRVQLTLAAVVVFVMVGGVIATYRVRLAAEKQRADERVAAEQKRQEDLRAADRGALVNYRMTRAGALVQALEWVEPAGLPRLIDDLMEYRDLTGSMLREMTGRPLATKSGLHARLVLLVDEPDRAAEVAAYLPVCKPDELLPIVGLLKSHTKSVAPGLWAVLADSKADSGKRVRAACALAVLTPDDRWWESVASTVVESAVKANPAEFVAWSAALEPVRGVLVPKLLDRYPAARARIESGKLGVSELAGEVSGYDLTANLLARYAANQPTALAELAVSADPRHYALFAEALVTNKATVVPLLKAEVAKQPQKDWTDGQHEALGRRRGHAAAALVILGEGEAVWPLFRFPADGDPTARSYLSSRLAAIGADPLVLIRRFETEGDTSAKRALLIALGDFPPEMGPAAEREALADRLLVAYREHPDPGLHGAIDWLLRQKWGKAKELSTIDAELAGAARAKVAVRGVPGAVPVGGVPLTVGLLLPAPAVAMDKNWYVNGEGQTFSVVRGPVEFLQGSPLLEPERYPFENPHTKRIPRTFAIATKEVTVEQFLRFRPNHEWLKESSPGMNTPAVSMTWYESAEYCNWLSAREGIPADQWCYEPNKDGAYAEGMRKKPEHLKLTGYRLPREAEWEFACRGGALTSRYYGRGAELLRRYGWSFHNSDGHAWPVGQLRPNELGLFDTLGNVLEWCDDLGRAYDTNQRDDIEDIRDRRIDATVLCAIRSGSFRDRPKDLRCASRFNGRPGFRVTNTLGFRPTRTLSY